MRYLIILILFILGCIPSDNVDTLGFRPVVTSTKALLTSDTSSLTPTSVSGLAVTLKSNTKYIYEAYFYLNAWGDGGMAIRQTFSGTFSLHRYAATWVKDNAYTESRLNINIPDPLFTSAVTAGGNTSIIRLSSYIFTTTGGSYGVSLNAVDADGGEFPIMRYGSFVRLTEIP